MSRLPKVLAVVGTNASGKSALGIELAKRFGGEIISADSRQVFKGLDLGSGKVTPEEMQGVPHHLIDVREPNEFFSMADFQKMSYAAIEDIRARGRLPMIVGGTGLYFRALEKGFSELPPVPVSMGMKEVSTTQAARAFSNLVRMMPVKVAESIRIISQGMRDFQVSHTPVRR